MKKLIALIVVVAIAIGGFFGYQRVYKISGRSFMDKNMAYVYVNENIKHKDMNKIVPFIYDNKIKNQVQKFSKEYAKYIDSIYVYNNDSEKLDSVENIVGVLDIGYLYPFALIKRGSYFDKASNDDWKLKTEYTKDLPVKNLYMRTHRGLMVFSPNQKTLDNFLSQEHNYPYTQEITQFLDKNKDSVIGNVVYGDIMKMVPNVLYMTSNVNILNDTLQGTQNIMMKGIDGFTPSSNRELVKYVGMGDIYISLKDYSQIQKIIFSPFILGNQFDVNNFYAMSKLMFNVNVPKALNEIAGEGIISKDGKSFSGIFKLKKVHKRLSKMITLMRYTVPVNINIDDGTLTIGNKDFTESKEQYDIPKNAFLFGIFNVAKEMQVPKCDIKVIGTKSGLEIKTTLSQKSVLELEKRFLRWNNDKNL